MVGILSRFGLINKDAGFRMVAKAGKVHRSTVQVASESMETFGVAGVENSEQNKQEGEGEAEPAPAKRPVRKRWAELIYKI